jgi:glucose/arabinose dehydrogenase
MNMSIHFDNDWIAKCIIHMKRSFAISTSFAFIFCHLLSSAQKGLPPPEIVSINHSTHYAQHVDFAPSMLNQLKVPAGWRVAAAATGLGKPRMLCLNDNDLYITRRDAGDVLLLKDLDGDNKFDEMQTVVAEFKGVHAIAIHEGWLYLGNTRELRRYKLNADGSVEEMQALINDLPDGGQHPNRTMAFGPDGYLYYSAGSTCNDCNESNKENATMLRIDPATWKRTIYARGLRNTIGFDWHPVTGELYGMDNGSDAKGDGIPPEELNKIIVDGDYGWPLVYGKQTVDETREDPAGTTKAAYARTTQPSILDLPAHCAPIGFQFFDSTSALPVDYRDDALVCWHGSWNKKQPDGFKVQRVKFENGKAVGTEDFLSGFLTPDGRSRFGRPSGLAISKTGVVYISDDANGVIYCIKRSN